MTDNTTMNLATVAGGDVVASEDIGPGVKFQTVKITLGVHGTNSGPVAVSNPMPVYEPPRTITNISGTITTGGTAQVLSASNATGRHFSIENLSTTEDLWFYDLGTATIAQPSMKLTPSGYYESPYSTTAALSIVAATTAHAFAAREW
jgi:hypothetical protein